MASFSGLIDQIGIAKTAAAFSVDESHVRTMKARDSIPPEYWADLLRVAPEYGINDLTFQSLTDLRKARFAEPTPAEPAAPSQEAAA